MGLVEAVRVFSYDAACELYPVATLFASERFGALEQHRADTQTALVASNVHALELTAPTTSVLKVGKDHDLTEAHDFTVNLGHQHLAATAARLFYGPPVRVNLVLVLSFRRHRPALDDQRGRLDVVEGDGTNGDLHVLWSRVDGRQNTHGRFDGLGGVQAEVLTKEVADDLRPGR